MIVKPENEYLWPKFGIEKDEFPFLSLVTVISYLNLDC